MIRFTSARQRATGPSGAAGAAPDMVQVGNETNGEIVSTMTLWPHQPTLENYRIIFTDPSWYTGYINSLEYVVINTLLSIAFAVLFGFGWIAQRAPMTDIVTRLYGKRSVGGVLGWISPGHRAAGATGGRLCDVVWRENDPLGVQAADAGDVDGVVPHYVHVLLELAAVLHQVVGEGIVVVDHQQHGVSP